MKTLGGYTQEKLDEIWDSHDTDQPYPDSSRKVYEEAENVLVINHGDHLINVRRIPGGEWEDTPFMNSANHVK